jgi:hypothetical protein
MMKPLGGNMGYHDKSTTKTVARLPRKPDQPGFTTRVESEKADAVETNNVGAKKRKNVDASFEPDPNQEEEADLMPAAPDVERKLKKKYGESEEVAAFLEDSNLPKGVIATLVNADPRLQVYLGLREKTPGGLRKTDLMEPVVKSIDLSNAAELQAYKDNNNPKSFSRMCKKFDSGSYYEAMAEARQDSRTIKPHNNPGLDEAPRVDAALEPAPEGVRRSGRKRNTKLSQKQKDIVEAADVIDEAKTFQDRPGDPEAETSAMAKITSRNYKPFKQPKKAPRAKVVKVT